MYLIIELQNIWIKIDRTSRRSRKIHNYNELFNTPPSLIDLTSRQKIIHGKSYLNNTNKSAWPNSHLQNLLPISRIHLFFMCTWNIYQNRPPSDSEISLKKSKRMCSLVTVKLEINNWKVSSKFPQIFRIKNLSNMCINNPLIKGIKVEFRKYSELNENENKTSKFVVCC